MARSEAFKLTSAKPNSHLNMTIEDNDSLISLPFAINYRWSKASKMINSGTIEIEDCDVFGEKINYAFYGRPAFRPDKATINTRDYNYYPVCFLIDPNKFAIDSVFPFDSGAFKESMYDSHHIPLDMTLDEFRLVPRLTKIKGFISFVYSINENYLRQKPVKHGDPEKYYNSVNAVLSLVNETGTESFDSRARTIEIISKTNVEIEEAVIAIICPMTFCDSIEVKEKLKEYEKKGISVIKYYDDGDAPNDYIGVIKEKAYRYYEKQKIVCFDEKR